MLWSEGVVRRVAGFGFFVCLSLSGQDSPDLMRQADAAFRAGKLEEAANLFEQVLANSAAPQLPAHMMLGLIRAQQGQTEQAITHFQKVLGADPANPHAHFYLGRLLGGHGDWPGAARHYRLALENGHPDREGATIGLALAEVEQDQAATALDRLKRLGEPADPPKAASYYGAMGLGQKKAGSFPEAALAFRKARDFQTSNPGYHEELIRALIASGDFTAGLNEAIPAQKKFPDHAGVQFAFGLAGYRVPETPFTHLALRNLRDTHPTDARMIVLEGLDHAKNGRIAEARAALMRALELGVPEAGEVLEELDR